MNKLDTAAPELVSAFQSWANGLFPPKLLIAGTTHGRLDSAWLDLSGSDERLPLYPQAHGPNPPSPFPKKEGGGADSDQPQSSPGGAMSHPSLDRGASSVQAPPPSFLGKGDGGLGSSPSRRYLTPAGAHPACGWVFDPADVFDEGKLLALLANTREVTRLKGVFRVADEWIAVNRAGSAVSVSPTAYRRDSRLEAFAAALDWGAFERELLACLLPR
ncbi:MAG: cobalamin biosynthesis protein CobW [Planctomycetes bacterium]|nr:cobalamin biosynthesis protein CobW [Planctomycetota bacterium]